MTNLETERLYQLIPAIYRLRDMAEGEPLRALLAVIEREHNVLEKDIDRLYQNWFIETCDEWIVPYIGDLLKVEKLYTNNLQNYGQQERRAYVANTLVYRRRKGTAYVLEQLTQDITGWRSRAVEFALLVSTTQSLQSLRPTSSTVDFKKNNTLEQIGRPFEQQAAYSVDVRSFRNGGQYNIANIGLFIWRLQSYPIKRVRAFPPNKGRDYYSFSPLGHDLPLFNHPQTELTISTLAQEINIPDILRSPVLNEELDARRKAKFQDESLKIPRYFDSDPVLQIFIDGQPNPIPPEQIVFRSLAHLSQEAQSTNLTETKEDETSNTSNPFWPFLEREKASDSKASETIAFPEKIVEIDPALGRFRFLKNELPSKVEVSYHYGFSDDIGGGPYGRDTGTHLPVSSTLKDEEIDFAPLIWEIEQATTADPNPLATAIEEWKQITTVWQGFEQLTHKAIARIKIPSVQIDQVQTDITKQKRSTFAPGIVKGLQVSLSSDSTAIRVTDGLAIDDQGKSLKIRRSHIFKPNSSSIKALPTNNEDNDSRVGILVLFASSTDLPNGNTALLDVVSECTIKGFPRGRLIPLAEVVFKVVFQNNTLQSDDFSTTIYPLISLNLEFSPQYKLKFSAGVVHGLEFHNKRGTLEAYITAGTGVDDQGNIVIVTDNIPLNLYPHQDKEQPLNLIIANGNQWEPQLLTKEELEKLEKFLPFYIYLSTLDIPKVTTILKSDELKLDDSNKNDEEKKKNFQFDGFDIKKSVDEKIQIMPGTLTDADGKVLFKLCEEQTIDLSYYAGQTIDLFVSSLSHQGFSLPLVGITQEEGWQYFGLVPQKPNDVAQANSGLIIIRDNGSYVGDLFIQLPTAQKLKIIASNGDRPHIKGDILIQGLAFADKVAQGELVLDGILIEGNIQVLPGNLKRLDIHHCTIVSKEESLINHLPNSEELSETDNDISIFTFLVYCLGIIWQLNCQELGLISKKSPLSLEQGRRLISAQFQALFEKLERLFAIYAEGEKVGESQPRNSLSMVMHSGKVFHSQRNSRLAIHLCCSILGTIRLSDTVPELLIEDCIITKNINPDSLITTSAMAIAAPGAATAIHRSTIFGRTQVKQLDASDSIFTEKVTVQRHQVGCVRFSYIPPASSTPPRYQCQPDQVLKANLIHLPTPISALAVNQSVNTDKIVSKYTWMMRCIIFNYRKSIVDFFLTFLILKILLKKTWININGDLDDCHITAILPQIDLYPDKANPETNGITVTPCILIGTESGQVLKASRHEVETAVRQLSGIDHQTQNSETFYPRLFAGTAGDGLFAYIHKISPTNQFTNKVSTSIRWRPLPLPSGNAPISLIQKESYQISGTVKVKTTNSQSVFNVFGQDTYFSDDLRVKDIVKIGNQTAKVEQIGRPGKGEISSQGRTLYAQNGESLSIGDTITIYAQTDQQQTRAIEKIVQNSNGEIIFKINKSFTPNLSSIESYVVNQDTELQIKQIDNNPLIDSQQEESLTVHLLWVGTLGNGLWRGSMDGTTWEPFNHGLPNLAVTALMRDSANNLWLGTQDDGVFQLKRQEEAKEFQQCSRWVAFNAGFRNGYVTALVEDNQKHLWLGTDDGLFNWKRPNSEQTTVRPKEQDEINGWTEIELTNLTSDFWVTGLAMETAERGDHLILTTADGKVIFLSTSERETLMQGKVLDCHCSLDFRGTDVTTVLIDPKSGDRFIGTAIGEIWQSSTQKDAWFLINEDFPNVARNRELLNQLQPSFTSDQFGNPAYGQLSKTCVSEICTGAEDGSEMGVFNRLKQPQREDNLRASLNEYLRVGLNAGIFYVT